MLRVTQNVNQASRSSVLARQLFALIAIGVGMIANTALADRVVVLRTTGDGTQDERDAVEDAVAEAITALSHDALTEGAAADGVLPQTANEMRAIAELQNAQWVVVPIIHDVRTEGYWLTLKVAYAPATRVEELDAEVRQATESDRLRALLQAMLRPEGLTEDGFRLAGEDRGAAAAEEAARQAEAEALRLAEEEAARLEEEAERLAAEEARLAAEEAATTAEREAAEAAAAQANAEAAFEGRERYGVADGLTMIQAGIGLRPLVSSEGSGGILGSFELRVGRGFEGLPGFELRGGVDIIFGVGSAFTVFAGAAYLLSPFTTPLHIGAGIELGLFQSISGERSPGFMLRGSAIVTYNFAGDFYLEGSLPEVMWITNGGGAVALGISARLGVRF